MVLYAVRLSHLDGFGILWRSVWIDVVRLRCARNGRTMGLVRGHSYCGYGELGVLEVVLRGFLIMQ